MRFHASWLEALREYHDEGRHDWLDEDIFADRDEFARYCAAVNAGVERPGEPDFYLSHLYGTPPPGEWVDGYVPQTVLWWVAGDEYLGRLSIRHRLTPHLLYFGGNIGFEVRPGARRRGHATAMLAAALPLAAASGHRPGPRRLRRRQRRLAPGHREERRRARRGARRQPLLLGADDVSAGSAHRGRPAPAAERPARSRSRARCGTSTSTSPSAAPSATTATSPHAASRVGRAGRGGGRPPARRVRGRAGRRVGAGAGGARRGPPPHALPRRRHAEPAAAGAARAGARALPAAPHAARRGHGRDQPRGRRRRVRRVGGVRPRRRRGRGGVPARRPRLARRAELLAGAARRARPDRAGGSGRGLPPPARAPASTSAGPRPDPRHPRPDPGAARRRHRRGARAAPDHVSWYELDVVEGTALAARLAADRSGKARRARRPARSIPPPCPPTPWTTCARRATGASCGSSPAPATTGTRSATSPCRGGGRATTWRTGAPGPTSASDRAP